MCTILFSVCHVTFDRKITLEPRTTLNIAPSCVIVASPRITAIGTAPSLVISIYKSGAYIFINKNSVYLYLRCYIHLTMNGLWRRKMHTQSCIDQTHRPCIRIPYRQGNILEFGAIEWPRFAIEKMFTIE